MIFNIVKHLFAPAFHYRSSVKGIPAQLDSSPWIECGEREGVAVRHWTQRMCDKKKEALEGVAYS